MQNIVSLLPVIPVRSSPLETGEMVTQMVFGEHAVILEKQQKWSFVKLSEDGYQGWVNNLMITDVPDEQAGKLTGSYPETLGSLFLPVTSNSDERQFYIPAGSLLYDYEPSGRKFKAGGIVFTCGQQPVFHKDDDLRKCIEQVASKFMNIPYLWGGKNPFGMDCSGLTQTVFKLFGRQLPRNSRQQVKMGKRVDFIDNAQTGDLAFFENEQGKIIHTGILAMNGHIIHASGMVRLDRIDEKGIYNHTLNRYTHKLSIIKNLID